MDGVRFGFGFAVMLDPVVNGSVGSVGELSWGGAANAMFCRGPGSGVPHPARAIEHLPGPAAAVSRRPRRPDVSRPVRSPHVDPLGSITARDRPTVAPGCGSPIEALY